MEPSGGDDVALQWRGPSPRLRSLRRTQVIALAVIAVAVAAAAGFGSGSPLGAGIAIIAVVAAAALVDILLGRRVRAWGFTERQQDLLVRRGVMFRRMSVIPYGRMQYVDVTAGPFERAFGLATVRMHTAAAASDARIPGLPSDEAARVRDRLSALGESQATGL